MALDLPVFAYRYNSFNFFYFFPQELYWPAFICSYILAQMLKWLHHVALAILYLSPTKYLADISKDLVDTQEENEK